MGAGYMTRRRRRSSSGLKPALIVTAILLGLGLIFPAGLFAALFFAVPGLFMFWLVRSLGRSASILTVPATMAMAMAVITLGAGIFGAATLLYSWLLVFPAALGLGLSVYGQLARKPRADDFGDVLALVGVGGFLTGAALHLLSTVLGALANFAAFFLIPLVMLVIGVVVWQSVNKRRRPATVSGRTYSPTLGDGSDRLDEMLFSDDKANVRR